VNDSNQQLRLITPTYTYSIFWPSYPTRPTVKGYFPIKKEREKPKEEAPRKTPRRRTRSLPSFPRVSVKIEASSPEEAEAVAKELLEEFGGEYSTYSFGPALLEEGTYELKMYTHSSGEAEKLVSDIGEYAEKKKEEAQKKMQEEMEKAQKEASERAHKQFLIGLSEKVGGPVPDVAFELGTVPLIGPEYTPLIRVSYDKGAQDEYAYEQYLAGLSEKVGGPVPDVALDLGTVPLVGPRYASVLRAETREARRRAREYARKQALISLSQKLRTPLPDVIFDMDVFRGGKARVTPSRQVRPLWVGDFDKYLTSPAIRHRVRGATPSKDIYITRADSRGFEPVTVTVPGEVISSLEELGTPVAQPKKYESVSATIGAGDKPFFLQQMLIRAFNLENVPFTGTPREGWTDWERWKWAAREVGKDLLQGAIGVVTFPVDLPLLFIQREKIDWSQAVPGIMQSIKTGELGAEILGGLLFSAGVGALAGRAGAVARVGTKPRVGTVIKEGAAVSDDVTRSISTVGDNLARSMSQVSDDLVRGSFRRSLFTEEDVQWFEKALPDKWFPLYKKGPSVPKTRLTQLSVLKDIEMLEHPKFALPQKPTYVNFRWGDIAIQGGDVQMAIKVGKHQGRVIVTKGEIFVEGELWKHPNLVKKAMQELAIRDPAQWTNFRRAMTRISGRTVDLLKGKGSWKDLVGAKAKYIVRETAEEAKSPRIIDLTKVNFRKVGPVYITSPVEVSPTVPVVTALATFFAESGGLISPLQIPESILRSLHGERLRPDVTPLELSTMIKVEQEVTPRVKQAQISVVTPRFKQEVTPRTKFIQVQRFFPISKQAIELKPALREIQVTRPVYKTSLIQAQKTAIASAGGISALTALGFAGRFREMLKSQAISTTPPVPPRGGLGRGAPPFFPRTSILKGWMVPVGVELLGEVPRRRPKKVPKKVKKKAKPKKPKTGKPKKRKEAFVTKKMVARGLFPRNVFSIGLGR